MSKAKKTFKKVETKNMVSEEDLSNIIKVFSIQSESRHEEDMVKFVDEFVADLMAKDGTIFYNSDMHGNLFITKGVVGKDEYYPCIVAHLDTVHTIKDGYTVESKIDNNRTILSAYTTSNLKNIEFADYPQLKKHIKVGANLDDIADEMGNDSDIWELIWNLEDTGYIDIDWAKSIITKVNGENRKSVGGCGDDKGGIWLALDLLTKVDTIKIALFSNEEIGCIGSSACDLGWFKDCGFIIQGDRKNHGDIIHDDICSSEFLKQLELVGKNFGYKSAGGLFTDVTTLVERGVGVSGVNVSVGYYYPHMDNEYTVAEELVNARDYVLAIINKIGKEKYPYTQSFKKSYGSYFGSRYMYDYDSYYGDNYDYNYNSYKEDTSCDYHIDDYNDNVVDAYCDKCNPIIKVPPHGIYICEYCGSELEEREHSRNCPYCMSVKIKLY